MLSKSVQVLQLHLLSLYLFGVSTQLQISTRTFPYRPKSLNLNDTIGFDTTPEASKSELTDPFRPTAAKSPGHQQCGGVRKVKAGEFGVIKSPGYPRSYPAGLDCEWMIEAPPGSNIQATLFDARTQNSPFADISDSIFMSLTGNWSDGDNQRYSGNFNPINPLILLSEGNKLGVQLRSSKQSRGSNGLKMAYYATERASKPAAAEPAHDVHTAVVCPTVPVATPPVFPAHGQSRISVPSLSPTGGAKDPLNKIKRTNPNPFLVGLILDDTEFCSGTLVSDRHVITSAGCTRRVRNFDLIFGTADLSLKDAGIQRRTAEASDVIAHPDFDERTGANDISVIRLKDNVTFTRFVSPAAVPSWNAIGLTLNDLPAEIGGWGDVKKGIVYTRSGELGTTILPNTFCRGVQREVSGLTMCSRPSSPKLCKSDSGSPVFTRNSNCPNSGSSSGATKPQRPKPKPKPQKPKPGKPGAGAAAKPKPKPNKPTNAKPDKPQSPVAVPSNPATSIGSGIGSGVPAPEMPFNFPLAFLWGVVSRGSCDRGFSITRITGYLDFLSEAAKQMP